MKTVLAMSTLEGLRGLPGVPSLKIWNQFRYHGSLNLILSQKLHLKPMHKKQEVDKSKLKYIIISRNLVAKRISLWDFLI